tara:strand:- start:1818 stop:2258 length:441 start_codon:yes stop_codon:yes gene_type:complete
MGTRSNIAYEKDNGEVVVMYCHYDGSPKYNGRVLQEHYKHPTQAIALVDNGYQSCLKETIKKSNEGRVHKQLPQTFSSAHAWLLNSCKEVGIEWLYLFTNNEWKVAKVKCIQLPSGDWGNQELHEEDFTPLWAYFTKHNIAVGDQS